MTVHTKTPWYVIWFKEYSEIHIQSAPEDSETLLSCDPTICVGLREAMSNAKLIVESVNEATGFDKLLINQFLFEDVGV